MLTGALLGDYRQLIAGHGGRLVRLAAWSLLGVVPALVSGWFVATALDRGFLAGDWVFGVLMLAAYAAAMTVGTLADRLALTPAAEVVEFVRDQLVRDAVHTAVHQACGPRRQTGASAVSRIIEQTEKARQLLSNMLLSAIPAGLALVASLIGLAVLAPIVGLIMLPAMATASIVLSRLSRTWRRRFERSLTEDESLAAAACDLVEGARDVLACGARRRAGQDIERRLISSAEAAEAAARVSGLRIAVIGLAARAPLILLLVLAPALVSRGALTAGEVLGAATYLIFGLEPALRAVIHLVGDLGLELGAVLRRLHSGRVDAFPAPTAAAHVPDRGDLTAVGLVFRYGPHSAPVLDRANLSIGYGEHVAIVGPSGIGKSTLAGVLAGLEVPESGVVTLGDALLGHLRPDRLRRTVVLMPQEAYVFSGTLRDNLVYLAPDAGDTDLDRAVSAIGLQTVVDRLGGYEGRIHQADALSMGERQLVTAARVYLSDARVVILDEATCHLDLVSEHRVEAAFADRPGTLIVIAHRISSALRADRVVLLDGGGLTEGTHDALVRDSPTYADLVGHWTPAPAATTSTPAKVWSPLSDWAGTGGSSSRACPGSPTTAG